MKYLFFDIECSNCFQGNGKICEFGYVLVDENFNVLKKDAIPINPGTGRDFRFDTKVYDREPGFQWAYDFDTYFNCEQFNYYYSKIKKMMEDKDTVVFGYAVNNDINYLLYSCCRYKLEKINFDAYDAQKIMNIYISKEHKSLSLSNAFKALCSDDEFVKLEAHLSRDDAYMTMRVIQEICEKCNFTIQELIELCSSTKYNSINFYNKKKELKANNIRRERTKKISKENQTIWGELYRESLPKLEDESCIGKLYTISSKIKESKDVLENVCKIIRDKNLVAYDRIGGSDYIICVDDDDILRLKSLLKKPYGGKFITYNQFLN